MISLKQFLDQGNAGNGTTPNSLPTRQQIPAQAKHEPNPWKAAWKSLLLTAADSAARAIPPLGPDLSKKLSELAHTASVSGEESPDIAGESISLEFSRWSDEASRLYTEHQTELRQIIAVVARTAETIGQRDNRYAQEIGCFAARLRSVAEESDLGAIRKSIIESAGAVQTCVARMEKEGRETVRKLTAQAEEYRTRMEEAERISLVDPLTRLVNRRGLDRELARRMAEGQPFSLTLLDLDEFKNVNDSFGHAAGDDLLLQMGAELVSQFGPPKVVARFGGDEFVIVAPGPASDAGLVGVKIRSWVLGRYRISDSHSKHVEVTIDGSLGSASWDHKETAEALLARADEMMYKSKSQRIGTKAAASERDLQPELAGVTRP